MTKRSKDTITLGSGTLYMTAFSSTVPSYSTLCVEANRAGYIKGGATLEYTADTYEETDDLGFVKKIIVTKETGTLKAGLLTWNGDTLEMLIDRCDSTTASNIRTTKIGGKGNEKGGYWAIGFKHEDPVDGDVYVVIVGKNTAPLSIAFSTDAGSVIEPEFTAIPQDSDGTLITLVEDMTTAG